MKLRTKAIGVLVLLIAMIIVTSALSVQTLKQSDGRFRQFVNGEVRLYSYLQELHNLTLQRGIAVRDLVLLKGDSFAKDNFESAASRTSEVLGQIAPLVERYGLAQPFAEIRQLTLDDLDLQKQAVQFIGMNHPDFAWQMMISKETPVMRNIEEKLNALEKQELILFNGKSDNIHRQISGSIQWVYAGIVLFILLSAGIYLMFFQYVLRPVRRICQLVTRIAHKDLTVPPLPCKRKDEIGELADSVNIMTDNLKFIIHQIHQTSQAMNETSQTLSERAEEMSKFGNSMNVNALEVADSANGQMVSIEENRRSINELVKATRQIAASATDVGNVAQQAMELARNGGDSMERFMTQMESIRRSFRQSSEVIDQLHQRSQAIDKVTDVIFEMARQTNVLSLNASIEAARAGAAGRGFAVVADEVRKLSQESEQSARQIAELIRQVRSDTRLAEESMKASTREVEEGRQSVLLSNEAMQHIFHFIQQVSSQFQGVTGETEQITARTAWMASAVEDIESKAKMSVEQSRLMAYRSREHLISVQQIAASSTSLQDNAGYLDEILKTFVLLPATCDNLGSRTK